VPGNRIPRKSGLAQAPEFWELQVVTTGLGGSWIVTSAMTLPVKSKVSIPGQ